MNDRLEQKLKSLPEAPGIYQMLDRNGNIIYIGKSKCLKKRVHSYFVPSPVWDKAKEMARFIVDLEIVVTDTHLEAMLLECEMIKKIKPHFNAMMKNDRKYSYLTLEENYRRNPLKITEEREAWSFGPFRSRGQLQEVMDTLRNLYPICRERRKYEFDYHIFPCEMDTEMFSENKKTLEILFSDTREMSRFLKEIERKMKRAASEQSFERALKYRDLSLRLAHIQKYLGRFEEWREADLVYGVPVGSGYKLFYISGGMIIWKEQAADNTEETRGRLIQHAGKAGRQLERTEKELMDYQDIVYAELSQNPENIYLPYE